MTARDPIRDSDAYGTAFEQAVATLPSNSVAAGTVAIDWMPSAVGPLLLGATATSIVLLEFSEERTVAQQIRRLGHRFKAAPCVAGGSPLLHELKTQLADYFSGRRRRFELPLQYPGTAFQQSVWSMLLQIPYGETKSYLDVARNIGDGGATRAVGAANGANPIAILIPCHRVVNHDGELGGYGGGLWRKRILLDLEKGQGNWVF